MTNVPMLFHFIYEKTIESQGGSVSTLMAGQDLIGIHFAVVGARANPFLQ